MIYRNTGVEIKCDNQKLILSLKNVWVDVRLTLSAAKHNLKLAYCMYIVISVYS